MSEYTISISEDGIWAGSGTRDQYGSIECGAVLSAAPADAQHRVYDEIEAAVTEAIETGQDRTTIAVNGHEYLMLIESEETE